MQEQAAALRDQVVRGLAKLSLVMVLGLMGAVFVGSAAVGRPVDTAAGTAIGTQDQQPADEGLLDTAHPIGLLLAALVVGGGIVVLGVGAFKAPRRDRDHELADLLRD